MEQQNKVNAHLWDWIKEGHGRGEWAWVPRTVLVHPGEKIPFPIFHTEKMIIQVIIKVTEELRCQTKGRWSDPRGRMPPCVFIQIFPEHIKSSTSTITSQQPPASASPAQFTGIDCLMAHTESGVFASTPAFCFSSCHSAKYTVTFPTSLHLKAVTEFSSFHSLPRLFLQLSEFLQLKFLSPVLNRFSPFPFHPRWFFWNANSLSFNVLSLVLRYSKRLITAYKFCENMTLTLHPGPYFASLLIINSPLIPII